MFADVDDDGVADRLSALRGPGAARQDRHAGFAADADDRRNVVDGLRNDDAARLDLIDRRIGRIQRARNRIKGDVALDFLT